MLSTEGAGAIKFNVNNGALEVTAQTANGQSRKIGQYRDGNLIAFYGNSNGGKNALRKLNAALKDGTATPVGLPENGYQTYKIGDEFFVGRVHDADIAGISVEDLNDLRAHTNSHTIGRHGSGVTDEQLLTCAQTGIAPDGQKGRIPDMSSRFDSPQQMVKAKNDIVAEFEQGTYTPRADGSIEVKINSSEVYGSGIARGSQSITDIQQLTGVTAILRKDTNGVWQIETMHPGAT